MGAARTSSHSVVTAVARWHAQQRAQHGQLRALRDLTGILWQFCVDSSPSRRRQRYGDAGYDWDERVDTTSATVDWRTRLHGLLHSPYQPSEPSLFHEMISRLPCKFEEFTFIDLGSGKGRALLMASDYPFQRIVGVELLPALHDVAKRNIEGYRGERQRCFEIAVTCGDARFFEFPAGPIVLYLFNPLPESGLRDVIANLERSLEERPREVWVVYHNPLLEEILAGARHLTRAWDASPQYVLYRSMATP